VANPATDALHGNWRASDCFEVVGMTPQTTQPESGEKPVAALADNLAMYAVRYSERWVQACPTLSWPDLNLIIGALRSHDSLKSRIEELEEALKPFCEVAGRLGWDKMDEDDPGLAEHIVEAPADDIAPGAFYCLMVQAFREAARAALKSTGEA
jgi:hypothetical protein